MKKILESRIIVENFELLVELSLQEMTLDARTRYESTLFANYKDKCKCIHHYLQSLSTSSSIPILYPWITVLPQLHLIRLNFYASYITSISYLSWEDINWSWWCVLDPVHVLLEPLQDHRHRWYWSSHPQVLCYPLYQPLSLPFQKCILHCCFPAEWKLYWITPIYKSGDLANVSNYRPISLLSSISKVLERLIFNHILVFISPQLSNLQNGFIPGRSCLQQLLLTIFTIYNNYSNDIQTDIIFLDFKNAFNSISHSALFHKLHHMGICGNLLSWIQFCLTDRSQVVIADGSLSSILPVTCKVPQGSILGPL